MNHTDFRFGAPWLPLDSRPGPMQLGPTEFAEEDLPTHWIKLDRPLQTDGTVTLEWTSAQPSQFEVSLVYEFQGSYFVDATCASAVGDTRLECHASETSFSGVDTLITWVAVHDRLSLDAHATLTVTSWTFADGTIPVEPSW